MTMNEKFKQDVETLVKRAMETLCAEGAAVAVLKDGEVLLAEGYGFADKENNVPLTNEYALPIGSSSKAFTATGLMMLAGEGKIDIDKPVREYMPRFGLKDHGAGEATARDLLCHRTGVPRHDLFWITWEDIGRDELIYQRLKHFQPNKPFRSLWQYNNHMYAAIGKLIEELSGKSWEEFTRERIFKPLGMTSSFFWQDEPDNIKQPVLYKNKDGQNIPCRTERVTAMGPAGSIRSTVTDMAQWLKFNLAKGKFGDTVLLEETLFNQLQNPNISYELFPFTIPEIKKIGYGLGWFIDSYKGELRVDHGGNVSGSSTLVSLLPEKNIGIVVLTNAGGSVLPYTIVNSIQDILLERSEENDWIAFYKEKADEMKKSNEEQFKTLRGVKIPDKPMTHEGAAYTGKFSNPGYGEVEVSFDENAGHPLSVNVHGNIFPMMHMHYDVFILEIEEIPIPAIFRTNSKGDISDLDIRFEFSVEDMIPFKRVPAEAETKEERI
jgi:CubicO group peptidase (beta-lactamase class C family)